MPINASLWHQLQGRWREKGDGEMDYAIIAIHSKHEFNARSNIDLRLFAIREMFTWHSMCHFKVIRPHNFTYIRNDWMSYAGPSVSYILQNATLSLDSRLVAYVRLQCWRCGHANRLPLCRLWPNATISNDFLARSAPSAKANTTKMRFFSIERVCSSKKCQTFTIRIALCIVSHFTIGIGALWTTSSSKFIRNIVWFPLRWLLSTHRQYKGHASTVQLLLRFHVSKWHGYALRLTRNSHNIWPFSYLKSKASCECFVVVRCRRCSFVPHFLPSSPSIRFVKLASGLKEKKW